MVAEEVVGATNADAPVKTAHAERTARQVCFMVMVFKDCAVASCYYYYQLSTALQKIIGYRIGYYVGNVSEALVDDSMDADKETLTLAGQWD